MNAYKDENNEQLLGSSPLFASSWIALFLLIRGQFEAANDDQLCEPVIEPTAVNTDGSSPQCND